LILVVSKHFVCGSPGTVSGVIMKDVRCKVVCHSRNVTAQPREYVCLDIFSMHEKPYCENYARRMELCCGGAADFSTQVAESRMRHSLG
jgi:hypothetical protein